MNFPAIISKKGINYKLLWVFSCLVQGGLIIMIQPSAATSNRIQCFYVSCLSLLCLLLLIYLITYYWWISLWSYRLHINVPQMRLRARMCNNCTCCFAFINVNVNLSDTHLYGRQSELWPQRLHLAQGSCVFGLKLLEPLPAVLQLRLQLLALLCELLHHLMERAGYGFRVNHLFFTLRRRWR